MKRFVLLMLCFFGLFSVQAQTPLDSGFLYIQGYEGSSLLRIVGHNLKIQRGDQVDSFRIKESPAGLKLLKPEDSVKIYDLLGIGIQDLQATGINSFLRLLNNVNKNKDKKLIFKSQATPDLIQNEGDQMTPQEISTVENHDNSNYTIFIFAGGALLIGFLLGWLLKPGKKVNSKIQKPGSADTAPTAITGNQGDIQQYKTALVQKQQEYDRLKKNYEQIFSQDKAVYDALLAKIVIPLQAALNQNNETELARYMTLAMSYMSSIAKSKLGKKHDFDEANVRLLLGDHSLSNNFPVITGATPIDRIPAGIRPLITFLKRFQIMGLENVIVNGYILKDL